MMFFFLFTTTGYFFLFVHTIQLLTVPKPLPALCGVVVDCCAEGLYTSITSKLGHTALIYPRKPVPDPYWGTGSARACIFYPVPIPQPNPWVNLPGLGNPCHSLLTTTKSTRKTGGVR